MPRTFWLSDPLPDKTGLALVPLPGLLALGDAGITLVRQPAAYWAGDRMAAWDFNPIVTAALQISPWMAIPGVLGYLLALTAAMVTLSPSIRHCLFVLLSVTHLVFIWGWLWRWEFWMGWAFLPVVVVVGLIVFRVGFGRRESDWVS